MIKRKPNDIFLLTLFSWVNGMRSYSHKMQQRQPIWMIYPIHSSIWMSMISNYLSKVCEHKPKVQLNNRWWHRNYARWKRSKSNYQCWTNTMRSSFESSSLIALYSRVHLLHTKTLKLSLNLYDHTLEIQTLISTFVSTIRLHFLFNYPLQICTNL